MSFAFFLVMRLEGRVSERCLSRILAADLSQVGFSVSVSHTCRLHISFLFFFSTSHFCLLWGEGREEGSHLAQVLNIVQNPQVSTLQVKVDNGNALVPTASQAKSGRHMLLLITETQGPSPLLQPGHLACSDVSAFPASVLPLHHKPTLS